MGPEGVIHPSHRDVREEQIRGFSMRHTSARIGLGWLFITMVGASLADAAVDTVTLNPATPESLQPFELVVAGKLNDLGYSLHTTAPTPTTGGYHLDLVIYRDPLAPAGLAIRPFIEAIQLSGLPGGQHTVTLREHTLLAVDPGELTALLSDPAAYPGPVGDPFGSYGFVDHTLEVEVASPLSPEPSTLALVAIGAATLVRRRR